MHLSVKKLFRRSRSSASQAQSYHRNTATMQVLLDDVFRLSVLMPTLSPYLTNYSHFGRTRSDYSIVTCDSLRTSKPPMEFLLPQIAYDSFGFLHLNFTTLPSYRNSGIFHSVANTTQSCNEQGYRDVSEIRKKSM